MVSPLGATLPGRAFELIDYKVYSWPGHGVSEYSGYQYNEQEWMRPDEYPVLISDPSDYLLRTYLPQIAGGFRGFARLGTALDPGVMVFSAGFLASWADTEVQASVECALAAGREMQTWLAKLADVTGWIQAAGFPVFFAGASEAPFDYLGVCSI